MRAPSFAVPLCAIHLALTLELFGATIMKDMGDTCGEREMEICTGTHISIVIIMGDHNPNVVVKVPTSNGIRHIIQP